MSSAQSLREFIRERLIAAAEEIFTEVDKTIVHYEEELDRQRRLLDISWKPQINLQRIDVQQQIVWNEEGVRLDQCFCNQESYLSLDRAEPGSTQIKDYEEKPKHLQLNKNKKEPEPVKGKETQAELETLHIVGYQEEPESPLIKDKQIDLPQELKENQEGLESLQMKGEQEEPESTQIKDEQEELCVSLEKELEIKQETDTFVITPTYGERDNSEPEPNSDQLQENQYHERIEPEDSGSSEDEKLKLNKTCQKTGEESASTGFQYDVCLLDYLGDLRANIRGKMCFLGDSLYSRTRNTVGTQTSVRAAPNCSAHSSL
ncbi:hypothetical protein CHARACLAT_014995 [Characodon lateralis]|uniref:Uncharacterized protein n=1 Tax=Characodon lateralis TaxID=208331 RepID=A0ABU7E0M4_9TELE|nr:hypothetical protein [Characodon lateralis]